MGVVSERWREEWRVEVEDGYAGREGSEKKGLKVGGD